MDIVIIAHFITEFVKNGTSRFVYIAEELSQKHNVELITSSFNHVKKQQRNKQEYNLKTKVTLLKEPSYPKNVCLKRFRSHIHFGKQVRKYLESRVKPDVIYCAVPSLDCAYHAAKFAQENNIKFFIDVQDLWPESFKMILNVPVFSNLLFYPMKRRANYIYSRADKIIAVSDTYCNIAKKFNKKNAECIPVFLGTKIESFDKYVTENRIVRNDDKFVIGYCGTLGHSYDIKCVLDALDILKQKDYRNISFWIIGDGPLKENFENYAKELDLDVKFYGRVSYDKMCGLLSACDMCVNPIVGTSAASIINKHADYAAAGIPVVNTQNSEEYRKLINDYHCGINCSSSNSNELANAILELMTDASKRSSMGKQARVMAEEKFDRDGTYTNIINAFVNH